MSFTGPAAHYDRFMGRYALPLAPLFADLADVAPGDRVLDVGCGPGALTGELVRRTGAARVAAVDPSASFVAAAAERFPGVQVLESGAEQLPFPTGGFDACLAQLVVHFLSDPAAGLSEMRRVTRFGGTVAACVWDFAEGGSPLSLFWRAARDLDPAAPGEDARPGTGPGQLGALLREAGLQQVEETALAVRVQHPDLADWWEPFTLGVGPAGAYLADLDDEHRSSLRDRCRALLPAPPFEVVGRAWAARGRVPGS